jgi:hypothetical protein
VSNDNDMDAVFLKLKRIDFFEMERIVNKQMDDANGLAMDEFDGIFETRGWTWKEFILEMKNKESRFRFDHTELKHSK